MKLNKLTLVLLVLILLTSCGSSGGGSSTTPPTLVSIAVTPANPSIALGLTQQLTARGTYSNSSTQNLTSSVTWNSSTPAVATISNAGLVTSVSTGTTTMTATFGNITSNSITITVTAPTLVSIEVTPADLIIPVNATHQYNATGTYSDSITSDITASVTWGSSVADVATISSSGLVTGVAAGTTFIMAKSGSVSGSTMLTVSGTGTSAVNVMPITVNGSLCNINPSLNYLNKPCVSVTICKPGSTTACQTIDDILLDTGSYGLRIFLNSSPTTSLVTIPLTAIASGTGFLANCARFGDGSVDWGPVKLADVVLGNERANNVPIQIIDANFGTIPASCSTTPDKFPTDARFNGILGVGLFAQDCGSGCASTASNFIYYSCNGPTCAGTAVSIDNQVTNPVVSLPTDSNGVIVQLPSVPSTGSPSINGMLVLGIDTRTNNASSGATAYGADRFLGNIITILNGTGYGSIIDSGSNGLFFSPPSSVQLPPCGSSPTWFCPAPSPVNLQAANTGISGIPSNDVFFQIGNFETLVSSSNKVFSNIGGSIPTLAPFDWGLPFYFGRNVYIGVEGKGSNLSTGPYFAY
jgi:Protein of unknown function (DUF3443)/Bacterial Ig-like domain (group 2)